MTYLDSDRNGVITYATELLHFFILDERRPHCEHKHREWQASKRMTEYHRLPLIQPADDNVA
jgi:hypothetical protein